MEQVRNVRLDNLCESIAEDRATKNRAQLDEDGAIDGAKQEMQRRNVNIYRHAGVELVRVPGVEKIRVRLTKETGDAEVSSGASRAQNAEAADTSTGAGEDTEYARDRFDEAAEG